MKSSLKLILSFLIVIFITSCSKDKVDSENQIQNENELDERTIIIDSSTDNLLIDINESTLVFSSSNNQIERIEVGSILASDMSNNAPNGYLREVVSIVNDGENVVINTIQSSLADAIKNVDFNYSYSIGNEDIISEDTSGNDITVNRNSNGTNQTNQTNAVSIVVPIDGVELYTAGDDRITLEGSLTMTIDLDFGIKIVDNSLDQFSVKTDIEAIADASLSASIENLPSISQEITLKTFTLAPITLPVFGLPVPIAKHWIVIKLGVDGNIGAGFTVGSKNTFSLSSGISYDQSSGWSNSFDVGNDFVPSYGNVFVTGEIEGWMQAKYEVRPYGLSDSRIFIENKTGPKLAGGVNVANASLLNLDLSWCFESNAKAEMKIFDKTLVNYDLNIYENCFGVASWSNNSNPFIGLWSASTYLGFPVNGEYSAFSYYPECPNLLSNKTAFNEVLMEFKPNNELERSSDRDYYQIIYWNLDLTTCDYEYIYDESESNQNFSDTVAYEIISDTQIKITTPQGEFVFDYEFISENELSWGENSVYIRQN